MPPARHTFGDTVLRRTTLFDLERLTPCCNVQKSQQRIIDRSANPRARSAYPKGFHIYPSTPSSVNTVLLFQLLQVLLSFS